MPIRGFETCIKIMNFLKEKIGGADKTTIKQLDGNYAIIDKADKITAGELEYAIKITAGMGANTIEKYKYALRDLKWISSDGTYITIDWKRFDSR